MGALRMKDSSSDDNRPGVKVLILGTADWDADIATNQHYATRAIASEYEVTFLQSIGLRRPRLQKSDLIRVARRLLNRPRSTRGRHRPANMKVLSAPVVPLHNAATARYNQRAIERTVREWSTSDGKKVLWAYNPLTYGLEKYADVIVYHCVDLIGDVDGIDTSTIEKAESNLAQRGAVCVASSETVRESLLGRGFREVLLWPNVADTTAIGRVLDSNAITRTPGVVFSGNLTTMKVDFDLLDSIVAARIPLDLAGPIDDNGVARERVEALVKSGAVYHGLLSFEELAVMSANRTVGVIPYRSTAYTRGVSPLKTFEYMRAGLGVVATNIPGVDSLAPDVVKVDHKRAWLRAVKSMLDLPSAHDLDRRVSLAENHSWEARSREILHLLAGLVQEPARRVVLLTRFNVRVADRPPASEDWLKDRLTRFRSYCVPSVEQQQNPFDDWIVFIDEESPQWFREELDDTSRGGEVFVVETVRGVFSGGAVTKILNDRFAGLNVLTTRLDNDDVLSRDFAARIRAASLPEGSLLTFVHGAQLFGQSAFLRPYPANPFLTYRSPNDFDAESTHVFTYQHDEFHFHVPVVRLKTSEPMWLQVVHTNNIANEVVGLPMNSPKMQSRFPGVEVARQGRLIFALRFTKAVVRILFRLVRKPARIRELALALNARVR